MEVYMEVVSPARLWWDKLGKCQVLVVVTTLISFFVISYIMGGIEKPAFSTIIASFIAVFFATRADTNFAVLAVLAVSTAAIATHAAFAAFVADATLATHAAFAATIAVTVTAIAVTHIDETLGVSKKVIRLSYTGEFLLILLPMLWAVRG